MTKRHGIGPIANKKASTFQATAPDGTLLTKRSFNVHTDIAFMATYQYQKQWRAGGIQAEQQDWGPGQRWLSAIKIQG